MGIDPSQLNDRIRSRMIPADRKKLGRVGMTAAEAQARYVTRTERDIHYKFISYLNRHRLKYQHSNPTRKSSIRSGTPDFLVGPRNNYGFFIEFKVPPNGLTPVQEKEIAELRAEGNFVLVAEETEPGAAYTIAIQATAKFFGLDQES